MIFSYYGFVVLTAALLFGFAGKSGAAITSELDEMTETQKIVASKKYQNMQEEIIMSGLDKGSKAAKATIEAIRDHALQRKVDGVAQESINAVIDAILSSIRIYSTAEHMVYKEFESALNLTAQDPKAAVEVVKKSIKYISQLAFAAGARIEDTFGSALAVAGGSNHKELKNSMTAVQGAGNSILAGLKIAEQIAIKGIEAGGSGAVEGHKAACEAIATAGSSAFEYFHKSAKFALEGSLSSESMADLNKTNLVPGIIESLKSNVSIDNPAALAAIGVLQNDLKSLINVLASQSTKDAACIMTEAIATTILETADAISVAEKALEEAGKLAIYDIEAAVLAVLRGIKAARDEVVRGSTIGFLGFGAARRIAGTIPIEGFIPPMIELILGRVSAYDDLALAQETALMGIYAGGAAIPQAINAGLQICEAAGNVLFIQYLESARIGLDNFRSY